MAGIANFIIRECMEWSTVATGTQPQLVPLTLEIQTTNYSTVTIRQIEISFHGTDTTGGLVLYRGQTRGIPKNNTTAVYPSALFNENDKYPNMRIIYEWDIMPSINSAFLPAIRRPFINQPGAAGAGGLAQTFNFPRGLKINYNSPIILHGGAARMQPLIMNIITG